ncbi:MAG: S41 family peptidase, partial [Gammaproteobacteria bacterium]
MPLTPRRQCLPRKLLLLGISTLLITAASLPLGATEPGEEKPAAESAPPDKPATEPPAGVLPLEELRIFAEVFSQIRAAYVEDVDDRTLLVNAIKGMLNGLDPHSAYLDKESFTELRENTTGEFGGVGLEVGADGGF